MLEIVITSFMGVGAFWLSGIDDAANLAVLLKENKDKKLEIWLGTATANLLVILFSLTLALLTQKTTNMIIPEYFVRGLAGALLCLFGGIYIGKASNGNDDGKLFENSNLIVNAFGVYILSALDDIFINTGIMVGHWSDPTILGIVIGNQIGVLSAMVIVSYLTKKLEDKGKMVGRVSGVIVFAIGLATIMLGIQAVLEKCSRAMKGW